MARSRGWDIARSAELARLAMTEKHETLAEALVAALSELTVVGANQTADAGSYTYKYADIADAVKLTRPALANHGIVALTPVHGHGDGLACTVILLHESGERETFEPLTFPHGRDAQATGSMITYHRRYALVAALGLGVAGDDDGQSAAPRERGEPARGKASSIASKQCALCDKPLNDGSGGAIVRGQTGMVHKACLEADEAAAASKDSGTTTGAQTADAGAGTPEAPAPAEAKETKPERLPV